MWFTWFRPFILAGLSSRVISASTGTDGSEAERDLAAEYMKLVRERPKFVVYALINNVACGRCGTTSLFLEEARVCLPRSVNLKKTICLKEEQYLLEYGDNAMGIVRCYLKTLRMGVERVQCLMKANELDLSPGLNITSTVGSSLSLTTPTCFTLMPRIVSSSRKLDLPFVAKKKRPYYEDRHIDTHGVEVEEDGKGYRPSEGLDSRGEYDHDTDREKMKSGSWPLGEEHDEGTERRRQDYRKRRRYGHGKYMYGNRYAAAQDPRSKRQRQRRRKGKIAGGERNSNASDGRRRIQPYRPHGHSVWDYRIERDRRKVGLGEHYETEEWPGQDLLLRKEERRSSSSSRDRQRITDWPDSGGSEGYDLPIHRGSSSATQFRSNGGLRKAYASDLSSEKESASDYAPRKVSHDGDNYRSLESDVTTDWSAEEVPRKGRINWRRRIADPRKNTEEPRSS